MFGFVSCGLWSVAFLFPVLCRLPLRSTLYPERLGAQEQWVQESLPAVCTVTDRPALRNAMLWITGRSLYVSRVSPGACACLTCSEEKGSAREGSGPRQPPPAVPEASTQSGGAAGAGGATGRQAGGTVTLQVGLPVLTPGKLFLFPAPSPRQRQPSAAAASGGAGASPQQQGRLRDSVWGDGGREGATESPVAQVPPHCFWKRTAGSCPGAWHLEGSLGSEEATGRDAQAPAALPAGCASAARAPQALSGSRACVTPVPSVAEGMPRTPGRPAGVT